MIEAGVIKLGKERTESRCSLVYGQMNEPPGARARVALTGLTVAEYFRDEENQDVLLFVDNVFRFTQACAEVSALLGRVPSAVGYQPTLATDLGALQERITTTKQGSITSVQAVYVPADDLTDPAPATTFAHLDATTVLSRALTELGIYPAVDPLDSTSRMLDPSIVGQAHYDCARGVQKLILTTNPSKISLPFLVWMSFPKRIDLPSQEPERLRSSFPNHSRWLKCSLVCQVDSSSSLTPLKVSNHSLRDLVMTTQRPPSTWLVVSRKVSRREERSRPVSE